MGCGLCGAVLGAECSSAEARGWYLPLCVGFFGTSKGIKRDSELRWDGQERQERLINHIRSAMWHSGFGLWIMVKK